MYIGYSVSIIPGCDSINQILTVQNTIEEVYDSIDTAYETNLKIFNINTLDNRYNHDYAELKGIINRFAPEILFNYENNDLSPIVIETLGKENEEMSKELVVIKIELDKKSDPDFVDCEIRDKSNIDFITIENKGTIKLEFTNVDVSTLGVRKVINELKKISFIDFTISDISYSSSAMRELFRSQLSVGCDSKEII